ncbi:unnamed protein product [Closterium sp. NIES-64]|nr:unnamed protein product [Closterium sp. NIES-64]
MARPSLQRSLLLCIFAGFIGACKPILARLSGSWRSFPLLSPLTLLDAYGAADAVISIVCYGGVLFLTVGMWHSYIESMEGISSLGATMISSSCSILWSGALGVLLLGEELKPRGNVAGAGGFGGSKFAELEAALKKFAAGEPRVRVGGARVGAREAQVGAAEARVGAANAEGGGGERSILGEAMGEEGIAERKRTGAQGRGGVAGGRQGAAGPTAAAAAEAAAAEEAATAAECGVVSGSEMRDFEAEVHAEAVAEALAKATSPVSASGSAEPPSKETQVNAQVNFESSGLGMPEEFSQVNKQYAQVGAQHITPHHHITMGTHPLISSCRIKLTLLHPSLTIPPPSLVPALTTPPLSLLPSPTILPTSLPLSLTDPTPSLLPSLRPSHVTPVKTTGWTYPVLEKEQECKAAWRN